MRTYLFPHYVTFTSSMMHSPRLDTLLIKNYICPNVEVWDGKIESLPTDERVMVRASTMLDYDWQDLAKTCQRLGHFVFYDDHLVRADGTLSYDELIPAAEKFLQETLAAQ